MYHSFIRFMVVAGLLTSLLIIGLLSRHRGLPQTIPTNGTESQDTTVNSLTLCKDLAKKKKRLNGNEAVQAAECFIVENGYTDIPPKDASKIAPESVDPGTAELRMRLRHDSLERHAYGFKRGGRDSNGWTIVFRKKYKAELAKIVPNYEEQIKKTGRAVSMDAYGRTIRVEHQDFFLDFLGLEKIIR